MEVRGWSEGQEEEEEQYDVGWWRGGGEQGRDVAPPPHYLDEPLNRTLPPRDQWDSPDDSRLPLVDSDLPLADLRHSPADQRRPPRTPSPRSRRPGRDRSPLRHHRGNSPSQSPQRQKRRDNRDQSPRRQDNRRNSPNQSPRRQRKGNSPSQSPQRQNKRDNRDQTPRQNDKQASQELLPTQTATGVGQQVSSRSPVKQHRQGYTRGQQHKPGQLHPSEAAKLEEEKTTARLEVFSIILHIIAAGSALTVIIPMAMVTTRWETYRKMCPLFVDTPPTLSSHWGWGNPDMTPCNTTAFLPIMVLALSVTLLLFHLGLLHSWRTKGEPPSFAFTRLYTLVVLAIVTLETVIALAVAITLTEGFRHTCISFDLNLSWNEYIHTCNQNYDDRDQAYMLDNLRTFEKIVTGLVGSWLCGITTILLTIVYMIRSKICSCELVCI
ncbi:serine/arginine repetitive matrix protein 1-like isoform X1 [Homarus americanus]|uniref:serine/arginine repetitive matrix protein 1-like isoform X1 n=1 Tax=Homarus americanus TaxID=6706 RepID=UPI001C456C6D|nr:serine/arginine repetitive matrix protein 1-like isoform X1 [Homarus americanus]